READIVIAATGAREPLFDGRWLCPGTHINAMGSNYADKRELDGTTVQQADLIVVDDLNVARTESGDLLAPDVNVDWSAVRALADVVAGKAPGRTSPDQITLFESQGLGIEDLAVAEPRNRARGAGGRRAPSSVGLELRFAEFAMDDSKDESVMSPPPHEVLLPTADLLTSVRAHRIVKSDNGAQRVIGLLNNSKPNVNFFLQTIDTELTARFPDYRIVSFVKPRSAGPCLELDEIAKQCDFAINAVADCGSCTAWSIHDSIELEKRGVATITVVTDVFEELSKEAAGSMGAANIRMATITHPLGELKEHEVRARAKKNAGKIIERLMAPANIDRNDTAARAMPLPPLRSAEEINDYFYGQGWTDGLPIVPPTADLISRFLATVATPADTVIGTIPPIMGPATVEKTAVNAAMAGCRREYLRVVIAAVKAICHPDFNLLPIQATTNPVTPLIIVNGPIVEQLQLNSGYNVLGQGWRSNATIGRALRLVLV